MSDNGTVKHFVVDTNVLLHNPNAIFLFADNHVIIPFDVVEELDKFKSATDDLGRNSRSVIRHLDRLRAQGNLADGVKVAETGGTVQVAFGGENVCTGLNADTPDNRIICCALQLHQQGHRVVFISKDINARIKADALGLVAEDFEAQKVDFEKLYTGWRDLRVSGKVIDKLYSEKQLAIELPDLFAN